MRYYARLYGEDEEFWGCVALLHDFDYEIHPTLDKHPQDGAPILREEGYPDELIEAGLSHAEHLDAPGHAPEEDVVRLRRAVGVRACLRARTTDRPRGPRAEVGEEEAAAFLRGGVHRDEVYAGAELLGLELDEHIANVVAAMQPIARSSGCALRRMRRARAQLRRSMN